MKKKKKKLGRYWRLVIGRHVPWDEKLFISIAHRMCLLLRLAALVQGVTYGPPSDRYYYYYYCCCCCCFCCCSMGWWTVLSQEQNSCQMANQLMAIPHSRRRRRRRSLDHHPPNCLLYCFDPPTSRCRQLNCLEPQKSVKRCRFKF